MKSCYNEVRCYKDTHHFGYILPLVYQQSLHYTMSADQAWHPVGAHQLLGMETSQRGARCKFGEEVFIFPNCVQLYA